MIRHIISPSELYMLLFLPQLGEWNVHEVISKFRYSEEKKRDNLHKNIWKETQRVLTTDSQPHWVIEAAAVGKRLTMVGYCWEVFGDVWQWKAILEDPVKYWSTTAEGVAMQFVTRWHNDCKHLVSCRANCSANWLIWGTDNKIR